LNNVLPNQSERVVNDKGLATDQARRYWLMLGDFLSGSVRHVYNEYADLTELQAANKNPTKGQVGGLVIAQGLAVYNGTDWVKASDYTTVIT